MAGGTLPAAALLPTTCLSDRSHSVVPHTAVSMQSTKGTVTENETKLIFKTIVTSGMTPARWKGCLGLGKSQSPLILAQVPSAMREVA